MDKRGYMNTKVSQEAAEWCIVMGSGEASRDEKAAFAEWITRSPQHLREYAAVEALWVEAAVYGTELRRDERVVSLFPGKAGLASGRRVGGLVRRVSMAAATASALLLGGLVWMTSDEALFSAGEMSHVYETMKGETRVVSLTDGSVVHLNTSSAVRVAYGDKRRLIRLESGQAYFNVRKDPNRPFLVAVRGTEVEAVGTAFDIEAFGPEMAVTVVEGEVVVRRTGISEEADDAGIDSQVVAHADDEADTAADLGWSASLKANQQIVLAAGSRAVALPPEPVSVAARTETAWRENKLVFDGEPLRRVAKKFNRYNRKQIVVLDEELQELKVSGSFDPRNPEAFVETMAAVAGLTVHEGLEDDIFLRGGSS